MKILAVILLITGLLFTSGCWDYQIIDDLAIAFGMGIDQKDSDPEKVVVTFNNPAFVLEAEEQVVKTTVAGYSIKQALVSAQLQLDKELVLGKLSTLVFSEETALNGNMHRTLQHLEQIRDVDPSAFICITRGTSAQHVLNLTPPEQPRVAVYLADMLNMNYIEGRIPRSFLFRYWFNFNSPEISPVIPIVELANDEEKTNRVTLTGLAAINQDGRMVGNLTDTEMLIFKFLKDDILRGRYYTHIYYKGENRLVTSNIKNITRKIKSSIVNHKPVIDVKIGMDLDITDIDLPLEDKYEEEVFRGLEQALSRDFQGNMQKVIKKTQEWETDIVGLGQFVRIQNPRWFREINWKEEYRESDINIQTSIRVEKLGTIINPR